MRSLSADEVRWLRVRAQGLAGDASGSVADAVRTAAAVQAQAAGPARLQIWSRTRGLRAADVDAAVADRAVVRTWLMRGTIHMVAADDLRPFLSLLGPVNLAAGRRRREQLGLTEAVCAGAMDALGEILAGDRALTRAEIVAELAGHGVVIDLKTQQPPHRLAFAANSALICRGPDAAGDEPSYVLLDEWLKPAGTASPDRETALNRLAERYFAAYGPATTVDFATWSGLRAADVNAAFDLVRDSLDEIGYDNQRLFVLRGAEPAPPGQPYRLLARFDPYLLGHRSRELILDSAFAKLVNAGGGMIAQTMLDSGRVVGTWEPGRLEPFEDLPAAIADLWQPDLVAAAAF
jgi:hypothetical protein